MQADIGGDADPVTAAIDVNLAAEERHDDAACLGNLVLGAEPVAHGKSPFDALALK
jgi:hypothetical protein